MKTIRLLSRWLLLWLGCWASSSQAFTAPVAVTPFSSRSFRLTTRITPTTTTRRSSTTLTSSTNNILPLEPTETSLCPGVTVASPTRLLARLRRRLPRWLWPTTTMAARTGRWGTSVRRRVALLALSLLLACTGAPLMAGASSGGRAGGTFSPSQRPAVNRSYGGGGSRSYGGGGRSMHYRPRPQYRAMPRPIIFAAPSSSSMFGYSQRRQGSVTTMSKSDVVVLSGVAGLVTYGFVNGRRQDRDDNNNGIGIPTNLGATSSSLMLGLDVPDRYDTSNIIHRLNAINERSDTSTRAGVQRLVSEVCLELVRQQASIQAAWIDSHHYKKSPAALQDFQGRSVAGRSRYDQETVSNFNDESYSADTASDLTVADGKATMAVVTVNIVLEGEKVLPTRRVRADVINLVRWMAATVPVASLVAGEVLWTPQQPYDTLTREVLDQRYPELVPLL